MSMLTTMLAASVVIVAIVAFSPSAVYAQTAANLNPVMLSAMMADRVVGVEGAVPAVQVGGKAWKKKGWKRKGWRGGFYWGGFYPYGFYYNYYPYKSYRYYRYPYNTCWWDGWRMVCG